MICLGRKKVQINVVIYHWGRGGESRRTVKTTFHKVSFFQSDADLFSIPGIVGRLKYLYEQKSNMKYLYEQKSNLLFPIFLNILHQIPPRGSNLSFA